MNRSLRSSTATRPLDERGAVGGLEALLFGFLILFGGVGLIVNAWTVVDTRAALDAAAREYLRSYTEQSDATSAARAGSEAAYGALEHRGTTMDGLAITAPDPSMFGPCQPVAVTLSIERREMRVPFIDALGPSRVSVTRSELVDAHREMTAGARHDLDGTPCGE